MESADSVAPVVRPQTLCGAAKEAQERFGKGAGPAVAATAGGWAAGAKGQYDRSAAGDVFAEPGRTKARADDGIVMRLGQRALRDQAESSAAAGGGLASLANTGWWSVACRNDCHGSQVLIF